MEDKFLHVPGLITIRWQDFARLERSGDGGYLYYRSIGQDRQYPHLNVVKEQCFVIYGMDKFIAIEQAIQKLI
jgi:sigma54-dependent transcription regulator